jgi:hypothetical protein
MTKSFAPKPIPKCPTCGLARGGSDEPLHAKCKAAK